MKTRKLFMPLSIMALTLVGCGGSSSGGNHQGDGDHLPYTQQQAAARLESLGDTEGLELSFYGSADGETSDTFTFGMKYDYAWYYDSDTRVVLMNNGNFLAIYTYDFETEGYGDPVVINDESAIQTYNNYINGYTALLYSGFMYDGLPGFEEVNETTYIGREVYEYRYNFSGYGVNVGYKLYIDKETGITLYLNVYGEAEGESGSASIVVASFKTGDDVSAPIV